MACWGAVFDSHCHLDLPAFDADRAEVLTRARQAGLTGALVPAIRPSTWATLPALRARHANDLPLALAIGVHPQVVPELAPDERAIALDPDALAAAAVAANAVAIGECGLDRGTDDREGQELILRAHVRAARAAGLPLVLHVLRAHDVAPHLLAEERVGEVGGVLHSYSGGAGLVGVYRDLGLCFSLAGPVTWPGARRPAEAGRAIPGELLLVETDAPDQSPASHRGGRCEPAFLPETVAALAALRGVSAGELAAETDRNARRLFRLPGG